MTTTSDFDESQNCTHAPVNARTRPVIHHLNCSSGRIVTCPMHLKCGYHNMFAFQSTLNRQILGCAFHTLLYGLHGLG